MMKKRILSIVFAFVFILNLCACNGFSCPRLNERTEIPQNGIIKAETLKKIKDENAIYVFTGSYNGFDYEWTVFGSDIDKCEDINLSLRLEEESEGVLKGCLLSENCLAVPTVLSVTLKERWQAQSAVVYKDEAPLCTASVTGSKNSIINFSFPDITGDFYVKAEAEPTAETPSETDSSEKSTVSQPPEQDNYLSDTKKQENGRVYSDGKSNTQDKYKTDPVPEGKPLPVEPDEKNIDSKKAYNCTFSIECSTIFNNLSSLDSSKLEVLPRDGVIFAKQSVTFYEGESVYDLLKRVCKENKIHLESTFTPVYNSAYVEGINNLYEFDCGDLSGWMYRVNGWYPNYGCSRYALQEGDVVEWRYTCDLGRDVGCDWLSDSQ